MHWRSLLTKHLAVSSRSMRKNPKDQDGVCDSVGLMVGRSDGDVEGDNVVPGDGATDGRATILGESDGNKETTGAWVGPLP